MANLSDYIVKFNSVDTLASVTARGSTTSSNITVGNLTSTGIDDNATSTALTVTDSGIAATLTTASQPNITSVGTLSGFSSTGIDDNATSTAITIDSSQNVGIGTTNPTAYANQTNLNINSSGVSRIDFDISDSLQGYALAESGYVGLFANTGNYLALGANNAEHMRIDSSGNVGIGTTSPFSTARLQVKTGTNLNLAVQTGTTETSGMKINAFNDAGSANIPLELNGSVTLLKTGETERMRIDSSGNVLVGVTSSSIKLHVLDSTADAVALFQNTSSATSGVGGIYSSIPSTANNTNCYHFKGTTQGVASYYLYGNGTSSFTSDERQKKNIVNTRDGYLDDLKRLRVVDYHWNNQEDTEDKSVGLIAQEVEQVFPHLVIEHEMEGVGPRKNLRGSEFTFVLIKAIQEQQAMIEELKAEVAASKGA